MNQTPGSSGRSSDPMKGVCSIAPPKLRVITSVTRLGDFWTLANFLKPLPTINLPQSSPFLDNYCKGVKIIHFSSETIFGQLL